MGHKKRLVVACDGTWVDSDNGFVRNSWLPWKTGGHLAVPSNVTRICRALRNRSEDGIPQVVYYQAGLGSMNDWYSYFLGGYLGDGISENIREAYAFLAKNYEEGDEITLIGFSRGAFTARSIGAMVNDIGLLTVSGMENFYSIFRDWQNQANPHYKPQFGSAEWPITRPKFSDPSYIPKLAAAGLTRLSIPVKATGVFDTVGVLGVPEIKIFGIKLYQQARTQYSFVDNEVPANVEYAYQALALDEERKPYSPTVWESPKPGTPSQLKELKQCWFPGVHGSIGGGYQDMSISDVTLAWMITQLSSHLDFNPDYILQQKIQNEKFYESHKFPVTSWAMGLIPQSDTGLLNAILGKKPRTPGNYYAIDPLTGKPTKRKLAHTNEFMHPSVEYRIAQKGPGLSKSSTKPPQGTYQPVALKGWKYLGAGQSLGAVTVENMDGVGEWDEYGKWLLKKSSGNVTVLVEEKIENGTEEMALLDAWGSNVAAKVLSS